MAGRWAGKAQEAAEAEEEIEEEGEEDAEEGEGEETKARSPLKYELTCPTISNT